MKISLCNKQLKSYQNHQSNTFFAKHHFKNAYFIMLVNTQILNQLRNE